MFDHHHSGIPVHGLILEIFPHRAIVDAICQTPVNEIEISTGVQIDQEHEGGSFYRV